MKFCVLLLIAILVAASAKSIVPVQKMRAHKMEKSPIEHHKVESKILSLRGGGIVSKDVFVKFFAYSMAVFGVQFLAIPETFWSMNFSDPYNKEVGFLGRMLGIMILVNCYLMTEVDAELAYKVGATLSIVIAYFGPYTATKLFKTKPAHKMPEILMPVMVALAAAAY